MTKPTLKKVVRIGLLAIGVFLIDISNVSDALGLIIFTLTLQHISLERDED